MLNKLEGRGGGLGLGKLVGCGGEGGGVGKKSLLLLLSSLLKNSFFSRSLFSFDWISQSLTSGALLKIYSNLFFTNINLFYQRTNYGVFCVKMLYINKSSIRFLFLIMFFEIGLSLLLKLASFNLLLVRLGPASLVFIHQNHWLLIETFSHLCSQGYWQAAIENHCLEKNQYHQESLYKKTP